MKKKKTTTRKKYRRVIGRVLKGEKITPILRSQGYSPSTIDRPSSITSKPTFQEELDEIIPTRATLEAHHKLYNTHRIIKQLRIDIIDDEQIAKACEGLGNVQAIKNEEEGYTTLIINEIDKDAEARAIDMSYKLRGAYSPVKLEVKRTYEDMTDKELIELLKG